VSVRSVVKTAVGRVRALLRRDRVAVPTHVAEKAGAAAQRAFTSRFPGRVPDGASIWEDEGVRLVVAVYERADGKAVAPMFFSVTKRDYGAALLDVSAQLRYRSMKSPIGR